MALMVPNRQIAGGVNGRGERIRTSGLYVPNVALYLAKLHPDEPDGLIIVGLPTTALGAVKNAVLEDPPPIVAKLHCTY